MRYSIGIEREGFRIDADGNMMNTPHPREFGDKLKNPLIGTDFGEPMLELRTHPHPDPESCYHELLHVTGSALSVLYDKGEFLWPYSVPYRVPSEDDFPFNSYPGRPDMEEHERLITRVYGLRRICLSGIHVNFSISSEALEEIRCRAPSVPEDKNEAILRCARQILKHEKALRHFFDASPTDFDGTLTKENSLRNSPEGFRNKNAEKLNYNSKKDYVRSLKQTLSYERLSAIRIKSSDKENTDEKIEYLGIDRIEFRLCDIDPFDMCGISLNEIKLAAAILFICMVMDKVPDEPSEILSACIEVDKNFGLGFHSAIRYYQEREKNGLTKSLSVRTLILENGYKGLLKLAYQYGAAAKRNGSLCQNQIR